MVIYSVLNLAHPCAFSYNYLHGPFHLLASFNVRVFASFLFLQCIFYLRVFATFLCRGIVRSFVLVLLYFCSLKTDYLFFPCVLQMFNFAIITFYYVSCVHICSSVPYICFILTLSSPCALKLGGRM